MLNYQRVNMMIHLFKMVIFQRAIWGEHTDVEKPWFL